MEPSINSENNKSVTVEPPTAEVIKFTVLLSRGIVPATTLAFIIKEKEVPVGCNY